MNLSIRLLPLFAAILVGACSREQPAAGAPPAPPPPVSANPPAPAPEPQASMRTLAQPPPPVPVPSNSTVATPPPAPAPVPPPATTPPPAPAPQPSAAPAATPAVSTATDTGRRIAITVGNQLAFDVTTITAAPGENLVVVLTNDTTLPKAAMGHNWVLLKTAAAATRFAALAPAAGLAADYIPEAMRSEIIAATRLLGPKESQEVRFQAPTAPGDYPYICSFPGHSAAMKGILRVQ